MSQHSIRVHLENMWTGVSGDVVIKGDANDNFLDAAEAAFFELSGGDPGHRLCDFGWRDESPSTRFTFSLDRSLTFDEVTTYFGEEADSDPATIFLTNGGRGGDPIEFTSIVDFVRGGLEVAGAVSTYVAGHQAAVRLKHRASRDAVRIWEDTGEIPMTLRQLVLAEKSWYRLAFDRQFGLSRERGSLLLRSLGYERRDANANEVWAERAESLH